MRDIDIRQELHQNFLSHFYQHDTESKIIDELGICQGASKVDIAVVNGHMWGWEIKSEKDTLERLPAQMDFYNKVFDYITIVTNENHLEEIKKLVPSFWGIMCVNQKTPTITIDRLREPEKNISVDSYSLVQLLWKNEALEILENLGLSKGLKSKPRKILWQRLTEELSLQEVNNYVRSYLKMRSNWRSTDSRLRVYGG